MKKLKKSIKVLVIICLIISLSGCTKCINTSYKNVKVKIADEYYRKAYYFPVFTGKVMIMVRRPAAYRITIEYNGTKYTISDHDVYEKYKDKIGENAIGVLEIREYDNGTTKYNIVEIK